MEWLDTESKIFDKLHTLLVNGGHPLKTGYLAAYSSVFLNAYKLGGPKGEHLFEVLQPRCSGGDPHAAANLAALCEVWSHWWALIDEGTRREIITLGPRGPYEDFVAPKR